MAREEGEGRFLQGYKKQFISMNSASHAGPLVLIDGELSAEDVYLAARLVARFGQGREAEQVEITVRQIDGSERNIHVVPFAVDEIPQEWYL